MASSLYTSPEGEKAVFRLYRSMLARWPVPHQERRVPTRHGDTFAIECGERSAPPLVLLHGAGSNSAMWIGDMPTYSRHHRVLAIDLPGEPGRSAPRRLPWYGDAWPQWLADALDGLEVDKAMFIGLSQGAWTVLRFAVCHPERVDRLVLVSPAGIVRDRLSYLLKVLPLLALGRVGRARIQRMVLGGARLSADMEEALGTLAAHFNPGLSWLPLFSDAALRRLTMPVQIVMGGQDCLRDATRVVARAARHMPRLSAVVSQQAGHSVPLSRTFAEPFLRAMPRSSR
jgi:pimeloyl-ACP methyl ester carboxylesterase